MKTTGNRLAQSQRKGTAALATQAGEREVRSRRLHGQMIVWIWDGKTSAGLRANKLDHQIWTCSADHHTGQRRLIGRTAKA